MTDALTAVLISDSFGSPPPVADYTETVFPSDIGQVDVVSGTRREKVMLRGLCSPRDLARVGRRGGWS